MAPYERSEEKLRGHATQTEPPSGTGLLVGLHALVTSKLDFGNAGVCGITGTLLRRLEMVQRAAARVVLGLRRRDHHSMTAALQRLHWLPVAYRVQFKLLTLMHATIHANCIHADTPRYLADRVSAYNHPVVFARPISLSLLF